MAKKRFKQLGMGSFFGDFVYERMVPRDHSLTKLRQVIHWDAFTDMLQTAYQGLADQRRTLRVRLQRRAPGHEPRPPGTISWPVASQEVTNSATAKATFRSANRLSSGTSSSIKRPSIHPRRRPGPLADHPSGRADLADCRCPRKHSCRAPHQALPLTLTVLRRPGIGQRVRPKLQPARPIPSRGRRS